MIKKSVIFQAIVISTESLGGYSDSLLVRKVFNSKRSTALIVVSFQRANLRAVRHINCTAAKG